MVEHVTDIPNLRRILSEEQIEKRYSMIGASNFHIENKKQQAKKILSLKKEVSLFKKIGNRRSLTQRDREELAGLNEFVLKARVFKKPPEIDTISQFYFVKLSEKNSKNPSSF